MTERKDNPAFEFAAATVPAEERPDAPTTPAEEAAWMMRQGLRYIADAAGADSVSLAMAIRRASGMSLPEIGAVFGVSKQAVQKRLDRLCVTHPHLAAYLGGKGALDENLAGSGDIARTLKDHDRKRRELTRWMDRPN